MCIQITLNSNRPPLNVIFLVPTRQSILGTPWHRISGFIQPSGGFIIIVRGLATNAIVEVAAMRTVFCRRTAGRAGAFELANDVVGVVVTSTGRPTVSVAVD